MKKVFFICFMILVNINLFSQSVDIHTAKNLGHNFLKHNTDLKSINLDLSYTASAKNGQPAFYVFTNKGKGFVIVSADNRMRPILGYSGENTFNSENINPNLNTFFCNYVSTMEYVVDNNLERSEHAINDWECLRTTGKLSFNRTNNSVEPLVKTTWNQSDIYNSMCPEDPAGFGGHVKSGCVANAMAQIMNYWEWPQTGEGTYSYQSDYGILEADFGNTNYRYELMPEFLDYTSPQAEIDAVALLQYHAGISVDMMYGPTASGAFSYYVPLALLYCFRYNCDLYSTYMDYEESIEAWENKLRESIDRGEPLYYAANGPDGGHAFVCSGYDANNLFHFNWGWQGFDNGYYAIDNFYLTYHDFPYNHEAIFNIRPKANYFNQPKPVDNVTYQIDNEILSNVISFNTPTQKINDEALTKIDSVIILRNDSLLFTFYNPALGETLSYEDKLDNNGVNYYFIYPMSNGLKGTAVIDTIMTGPTCDMTFNLYDSDNDGWLSPSISILDSRGIVVKRLGLENGAFDTMTVPVPDNDTITLLWNYVNAAYSDEDDECSFDVYYDNSLIYESDGKPQVGSFLDYYVDCEHEYVEETQAFESIDIFPNPAKETLNVTGLNIDEVIIYNYLGQKMKTQASDFNVIDISELSNGLYLINIKDKEGNTITEKFVKE